MKVIDIAKSVEDGADAAARPASLSNAASHSLSRCVDQIVDSVLHQSDLAQAKLRPIVRPVLRRLLRRSTAAARLRHAMQQMPLMRAERTYNTAHPDYDR